MNETLISVGTWIFHDGPAALGNHLWQSTLFALAIGALALMFRKHGARVRHALWLVASLKFLVPFAALTILGSQLSWHPDLAPQESAATRLLTAGGGLSAPIAPVADQWQLLEPRRTNGPQPWLLQYETLVLLLALAWLLGGLVVASHWLIRWRAVRRTLRTASPASFTGFPAPARVTTQPLEPGIVGIFRPVLLLPTGLEDRLTPEQLRAVLAHESHHLRRRDNLTAALHMLVEVLFWFHPLVWWIGARLIDERERACDEAVVQDGHAPQSYAEAILRVCEHYIVSRLPCVSGVSGSDLRKRVASIVSLPLIARLGASWRWVLASLACAVVATPIAAGIVAWRSVEGRSSYRSASVQYWSLLELDGDGTSSCTPRSASLVRKQVRLAKAVGRLGARDGDKALLFAVLANSAADARRLLAEGAVREGDGFLMENSLTHIAAQFGDPALLQVLQDSGFDLGGLAASLGADDDVPYARTPLMLAIATGRKDNADWLIRHGADVNEESPDGSSALTYAIALCKDRELVASLVAAGARPNAMAMRIAANMNFDLGTADVAAELPAGWKAPDPEQLSDQDLRANSPSRYTEARADFDGDGDEDQAALFIAKDGSREGLFVKLSSRARDGWLLAATMEWRTPSTGGLGMGITVARAGTHATACSKGYGRPCEETGEPAEATLQQPGILFFRFESAGSLVYWDVDSDEFKRVWISD